MDPDPSRRAQFAKETGPRGEFVRQESTFRRFVRVDATSEFPAAAGRYHLYVSYACPWAHRTIIVRRLKRLDDAVSLTVVDPIRDERGWAFTDSPGCGPGPVNGFRFLAEAYRATDPGFEERVTVPVLCLSRYLGELATTPGVAETIDIDHIKRHYYVTHGTLNPSGIVPLGPLLPPALRGRS